MKKSLLILFTVVFALTSCSKDNDPVDNTTVPTLTTLDITDITPTSATSGGDITATGGADITAKGVCWSTSQNPTILDFASDQGGNPSNYTSNISGLTANTTYYVRAYATNSKGTGYGNELEFIAENIFPGEKVSVAGGTFQMGSTTGGADEAPVHSVTVSNFSISKHEITNAQYAIFMNDIGANIDGSFNGVEYLDMDGAAIQISHTSGSFMVDPGKENFPVIEVSWFGAKAYSEHYGGRLPTEAEWEFAAEGGASSVGYIYSGSNTIDDVAWYTTNSGSATHPVGTKSANELGLHDMSGNVWEWTNDWYASDYYSSSPSNNPQGPLTGASRVFRGGSWFSIASSCRVADRNNNDPTGTFNRLGFRPIFFP
ncbi:formylglycine-generating enzyme family protein [Ulvibacter antarcticus]|uniref:Formylglycine-generating enzyme required for sulfatase activity n=1 Tax=Ulvibacter antarcticus TaxID=442714 RepID=A0A3L9Z6S0_9FLAO|nr:formylglycine-generating enzyme family protein [Ulvibacter antarcticus]RMA67687.1 formylglycine-generating enzyme required for sulfatase activity [Ulvibacter antarcticus]